MSRVLLAFVLLGAPTAVREWAHWQTMKGQPRGVRVGGVVSVCIWIPSHWILLALAFRAIVAGRLGVAAWLGYAVYWFAIALRVAALRALREFYSPDVVIREGHAVVDRGPYRWIRHPLHTALIVELTGLWLVSGVWYGSLLVLVSFLAHLVRSRREELLLEHHLGDSYRSYRRRTWDPLDLFPGRPRS